MVVYKCKDECVHMYKYGCMSTHVSMSLYDFSFASACETKCR